MKKKLLITFSLITPCLFLSILLFSSSLLAGAPDTLWTRTYGGANTDEGWSVQQTSDGGFIIGGITMALLSWGMDAYLIRVDNNGDTLWTRNFGGPDFDVGYSVQQTHDSGYIITGETSSYSSGSDDVYLIRTDSNGDTIWVKVFEGMGMIWGFLFSRQMIKDI